MKRKLKHLCDKWMKSSEQYNKECQRAWTEGDKLASRRYEGEAIALRWCAEDLSKLFS